MKGSTANRVRWIGIAAIIVGWYLLRSEDDSTLRRVMLFVAAFVPAAALLLWDPPELGVFRRRFLGARAKKVFVEAKPNPRDPFEVRRRYKVRKSAGGVPESSVRAGQVLCYIGRARVSYDRLISFNFLDENGDTVFWSLRDHEPTETWRQYFEELA